MERHNRPFYPPSPPPGNGHHDDWIVNPFSIVFTEALLFVVIFLIIIFLGWRQFETTRHNVLSGDKTTANFLADLLLAHNKATTGILQSYARRREMILTASISMKTVNGIGEEHLKGVTGDSVIILDAGKLPGDERTVVHEEAEHGV